MIQLPGHLGHTVRCDCRAPMCAVLFRQHAALLLRDARAVRLHAQFHAAGNADQRIGTSPAPKAVSIRTSSHFGPTLTSGKSPTAT